MLGCLTVERFIKGCIVCALGAAFCYAILYEPKVHTIKYNGHTYLRIPSNREYVHDPDCGCQGAKAWKL